MKPLPRPGSSRRGSGQRRRAGLDQDQWPRRRDLRPTRRDRGDAARAVGDSGGVAAAVAFLVSPAAAFVTGRRCSSAARQVMGEPAGIGARRVAPGRSKRSVMAEGRSYRFCRRDESSALKDECPDGGTKAAGSVASTTPTGGFTTWPRQHHRVLAEAAWHPPTSSDVARWGELRTHSGQRRDRPRLALASGSRRPRSGDRNRDRPWKAPNNWCGAASDRAA